MKLLHQFLALSFITISVVKLDASEDTQKFTPKHTAASRIQRIVRERIAQNKERETKVDANSNSIVQSERNDSASNLDIMIDNEEESIQKGTDLQKISGFDETSNKKALTSNLEIIVENSNEQEETSSVDTSFTDNLPTNPNSKSSSENEFFEPINIDHQYTQEEAAALKIQKAIRAYNTKKETKNKVSTTTTINHVRTFLGLEHAQASINPELHEESNNSSDTDSATITENSIDNLNTQKQFIVFVSFMQQNYNSIINWVKTSGNYLYKQNSIQIAQLYKLLGYIPKEEIKPQSAVDYKKSETKRK